MQLEWCWTTCNLDDVKQHATWMMLNDMQLEWCRTTCNLNDVEQHATWMMLNELQLECRTTCNLNTVERHATWTMLNVMQLEWCWMTYATWMMLNDMRFECCWMTFNLNYVEWHATWMMSKRLNVYNPNISILVNNMGLAVILCCFTILWYKNSPKHNKQMQIFIFLSSRLVSFKHNIVSKDLHIPNSTSLSEIYVLSYRHINNNNVTLNMSTIGNHLVV